MGNTFGKLFRLTTFGESHGKALGAIVDGCPAGLDLDLEKIRIEMQRRKPGQSKITTQRKEEDEIELLSGVFEGKTTGTPIGILIPNEDQKSKDYAHIADAFRPSHADYTYFEKYGHRDHRGGGRSSARETAARVALGAVARNFLEQSVGITILSHVLSIGSVRVPDDTKLPSATDMKLIDEDPVRCADAQSSQAMIAEIEKAHRDGDTLGGVVEVLAFNMPPGLGSHVHWDRRLDSKLAGAVMGIQAIKGVEIGDGFLTATRRGSVAHDEIEKNSNGAIVRRTDRAGGTEGGMSNGEILRVRAAMKPISTVPKALDTIDVSTGEAAKAINQRSDVCAVPAAGVVAEAMVALVLAEAVLEKFGGDSVTETRRNFESYMSSLNFK